MTQLDLQQDKDRKELARQLSNAVDDLSSYLEIKPEPKNSQEVSWQLDVFKLALKQLTEETERDAIRQQLASRDKELEVLEVLNGQKDECIDVLQQQVNSLAAENLELKDAIDCHRSGFTVCKACGEENGGHNDDVCLALEETPATDAIKRQWMAEGVEIAISQAFREGIPVNRMQFIAKMAAFAAQLRQPEEKGHE